MSTMAVKTVRRNCEKREKPSAAPRKTKPTTARSSAIGLLKLMQEDAAPEEVEISYNGSIIMRYYVNKPRDEGMILDVDLVYNLYGRKEVMSFRFQKDDIMRCMPTNLSVRLDMLRESIIKRDAARAATKASIEELLNRKALSKKSDRSAALRQMLHNPRAPFHQKLRNMIRAETLYYVLKDPKSY